MTGCAIDARCCPANRLYPLYTSSSAAHLAFVNGDNAVQDALHLMQP